MRELMGLFTLPMIASGKYKKIIIQVKSGHVSVSQVRDLKGVMEREKAVIGALITLKSPTRQMRDEAAAARHYEPESLPGQRFPRLQILTIAELFAGKTLSLSPAGHRYLQESPPKTQRPVAGRKTGKVRRDDGGIYHRLELGDLLSCFLLVRRVPGCQGDPPQKPNFLRFQAHCNCGRW